MSEEKPKRRWYLRTLLIAVALTALAALGWVGYSLNWIAQRHEARKHLLSVQDQHGGVYKRNAPAGLWLFGEEGVEFIFCADKDIELVNRLFPEAKRNPSVSEYPPVN